MTKINQPINVQTLLETWIKKRLSKTIKKPTARVLKTLDIPTISYKTLTVLKKLYHADANLTDFAGKIGKLILMGIEDLSVKEGMINRRRIDVGLEIITILHKNGVVKIFRSKVQKRLNYSLSGNTKIEEIKNLTPIYGPNEFITGAFLMFPVDEIPLYVNMSYTRPLVRNSFSCIEGGDMVAKINYDNKHKFSIDNCPVAYKVLNIHNATPFIVNDELLSVVNDMRNDDTFTLVDIQVSRTDYDNDEDYQVAVAELDEAKQGKLREIHEVFAKANQVQGRIFHHYHRYDFRSRMGFTTTYFNPAASKLARSLHMFANKKLVDKEALSWMLLSTTNAWGEDKLALDDRIDYAENRLYKWLKWAEKPLNYIKEWSRADDKFGFLAHIIELKNYYKATEASDDFYSGLAVHFDATCSGLQILSALSRDRKSAELCNLTRTDQINDYYLHIADYVWAQLQASNDSGAAFWLSKEEFRRSIVKRSGMIYFYSAQETTMGEAVYDDHRWDKNFNGLTYDNSQFLGQMIYDACQKLMKGPAKLMKLFINMGTEEAKLGQDLELRGPTNGMPMIQNYREDKMGHVKYALNGKEVRLKYCIGKGHIQKLKKIKSSSAPNIVHMLDAQIVAAITLMARKEGYDVYSIHDSFATVPADAGRLFEDLRTCFVDIFSEDILWNLLDQTTPDKIRLWETIEFGDYDINEVMDNDFCFS